MEGHSKPLLQLLVGGFSYVIPAYQRNYDWKQENCARLFDDLVALANSGRKNHFFGSVVSVESSGFYTERLIIDGQQRVTTVSLLLLALQRLIQEGALEDTNGRVQAGIHKCLMEGEFSKEFRLKLKPIKKDLDTYQMLFSDPENAPSDSNLTLNYMYFRRRIQQRHELTAKQLFDAIGQLLVIDVGLKQEDDPQLVFESLNSTGLALTEGDKIRNFVLMGLDPDIQDEFYEKYWNKIEQLTEFDVSGFVRDWLSVKNGQTPSISKVYQCFRDYRTNFCTDSEALLKDMLMYAELYSVLIGKLTGHRLLDECVARLNHLETSVTRPFFLEVLRLQKEAVIDWDAVTDIFTTTETYLFRRMMCDLPTNCLNKIFVALHKEIEKYDGTTSDYVRKFKYALLAKTDRGRLPRDDEFSKAILEREVYKMSVKNRTYILERYECFGTEEHLDVYKKFELNRLSIEHIMPQHLTQEWARDLGEDYESIHSTWLHRLANLTLTSYNSQYSNASFEQKVEMKHGFKDSGVRMNKWVAAQTAWGENELVTRSNALAERAKEIWPCPDYGDLVIKEKPLDNVSLADAEDLSGRLIAGYSLRGLDRPVTSWIEMFNQVVKTLHSENPTVIAKLSIVNDPARVELSQYFSHKPADLCNAGEIEPGLYSEQNSNTAIKIMILRRLFEYYGIDPDELVFSLREPSNEESIVEPPRRDLRRRYWAFALPIVKNAHGDAGVFSKASPNGENWMDGFFGEGGVHFCIKANFSNVQAMIYMKSFRAKPMFDYLASRRDEIETSLGARLEWNRGDELKHSRISISMDGVSIENESDWPVMAKFQADWTRRFYDVVVPIIHDFNVSYRG